MQHNCDDGALFTGTNAISTTPCPAGDGAISTSSALLEMG